MFLFTYKFYYQKEVLSVGLQIHQLYLLQRDKISSEKGVLSTTLNCLWWWNSSSGIKILGTILLYANTYYYYYYWIAIVTWSHIIVYKLWILRIVTLNYSYLPMIIIISYLKPYNCLKKWLHHWITQQRLTCWKTNQSMIM